MRQHEPAKAGLPAESFMKCKRIGLPPMSTGGLGSFSVASRRRVPIAPHRMTTGM
jgi:hypothetical protein